MEPSLSLAASRTESGQRTSRAQPSFANIQVSVRRDRSALAGRRAGRLREFGRPRWYDEFVVERRASAAEEHWGRRSPDGRRDQLQAASATSGEQPHTYPAIDGANNGEGEVCWDCRPGRPTMRSGWSDGGPALLEVSSVSSATGHRDDSSHLLSFFV